MNSKGQLFSLDFIIAIAFVILAVGLLYKQAEVFSYNQKDDALQSELYRIGLNASNQLVSNKDIVCQLKDISGNTLDYLPNCLPRIENPDKKCPPGHQLDGITKKNLGIPDSYHCLIKMEIDSSNHCKISSECQDTPSDTSNVFSMERDIVRKVGNSAGPNDWKDPVVSKQDFDSCVNGTGTCSLASSKLLVQVWK